MSSVRSITCGLCCCRKTRKKQLPASIALRVTAVILGILAITMGILVLCGTPGFRPPGLSPLGLSLFKNIVGSTLLSVGALTAVVGISIQCVKQRLRFIEKNPHENNRFVGSKH